MIYQHNKMVKEEKSYRNLIVATIASVGLLVALAAPTFAAKPANPGCFGQARAAGVDSIRSNANEPGASEWGHIAAVRAGTNGDANQTFKTNCGG